jgi:U3 small nucleolar RNA-associated protein 14
MPPRIARSSVQIANPKNARNKNRKRNLDAFAIAGHETKEKPGVKRSRLGEYLDDGPTHKRRRAVENEDGDEESVEEDVPEGKRRRTADDEDMDRDEGSDSEGNEWRLGGLRSDDSDSELDSDDAFGESDEDKFEGFTFRGSKSNQTSSKRKISRHHEAQHENAVDLNEDDMDDAEESDEDDFGDEGVDLATMLDNEDEDDTARQVKPRRDAGEEEIGDEDDVDDDEMSELSSFDEDEEDDENDNEERAARMRDRLDALDAMDKPTKTSSRQPAALTVDDLLATLDPASRKQYDAALKTKKKSAQPKTLTAPLPKRQQDRLNREVATQKAKEQLDRWRDTVIQNRRAEFLSFPLKHSDEGDPMGKDKFIIDGKPRNELEENIQRIMEESGLASSNKQNDGDDDIIKSEELATNKLPVEEVMRRRAELRRARELLFREEIKAKRIAKIKSKSYRRVHRKERERMRELEAGDEEDEKEANDRKRAMARMSTKHRDSKFAKALKETNRSTWDEGARDAVIEEARRREELKRRIQGEDVDSGSEDEGDDFEGFSGDEDNVLVKKLESGKDYGEAEEEKGLNGMKFMRAARERQRAQNDEDVKRLRKEMAIEDGNEEESDDAIDDQGLGRAIFGPQGKPQKAKKAKRPEMEEGEESEQEGQDDEENESGVMIETPKTTDGKDRSVKQMTAHGPLANRLRYDRRDPSQGNGKQEEDDWLLAPSKTEKRTDNTAWLSKKTNRKGGKQDVPLVISKGSNGSLSEPQEVSSNPSEQRPPPDSQARNTNGWQTVKYNGDQSDSDPEPTDPVIPSKNQAYHSRAFAGDEVASTFTTEKDALVASEDEQETSNHLPGWGSWAGAGLSKSLRRANARQKHNPLFKTKTPGTKPADRKDAELENVIISEKNARKGRGYLAPILPHGYETKEQYERAMRLPVGPEWTTKEVFQRQTKPRVVVGKGKVIEAMERPMV